MNRVWTRAHDAVIAEKCEGWKPIKHSGGIMRTPQGHGMYPSSYSTDIQAAIRAAEAWRKQRPERYWEHGVNEANEEFARAGIGFGYWKTVFGPSALAWALWEAAQ